MDEFAVRSMDFHTVRAGIGETPIHTKWEWRVVVQLG